MSSGTDEFEIWVREDAGTLDGGFEWTLVFWTLDGNSSRLWTLDNRRWTVSPVDAGWRTVL